VLHLPPVLASGFLAQLADSDLACTSARARANRSRTGCLTSYVFCTPTGPAADAIRLADAGWLPLDAVAAAAAALPSLLARALGVAPPAGQLRPRLWAQVPSLDPPDLAVWAALAAAAGTEPAGLWALATHLTPSDVVQDEAGTLDTAPKKRRRRDAPAGRGRWAALSLAQQAALLRWTAAAVATVGAVPRWAPDATAVEPEALLAAQPALARAACAALLEPHSGAAAALAAVASDPAVPALEVWRAWLRCVAVAQPLLPPRQCAAALRQLWHAWSSAGGDARPGRRPADLAEALAEVVADHRGVLDAALAEEWPVPGSPCPGEPVCVAVHWDWLGRRPTAAGAAARSLAERARAAAVAAAPEAALRVWLGLPAAASEAWPCLHTIHAHDAWPATLLDAAVAGSTAAQLRALLQPLSSAECVRCLRRAAPAGAESPGALSVTQARLVLAFLQTERTDWAAATEFWGEWLPRAARTAPQVAAEGDVQGPRARAAVLLVAVGVTHAPGLTVGALAAHGGLGLDLAPPAPAPAPAPTAPSPSAHDAPSAWTAFAIWLAALEAWPSAEARAAAGIPALWRALVASGATAARPSAGPGPAAAWAVPLVQLLAHELAAGAAGARHGGPARLAHLLPTGGIDGASGAAAPGPGAPPVAAVISSGLQNRLARALYLATAHPGVAGGGDAFDAALTADGGRFVHALADRLMLASPPAGPWLLRLALALAHAPSLAPGAVGAPAAAAFLLQALPRAWAAAAGVPLPPEAAQLAEAELSARWPPPLPAGTALPVPALLACGDWRWMLGRLIEAADAIAPADGTGGGPAPEDDTLHLALAQWLTASLAVVVAVGAPGAAPRTPWPRDTTGWAWLAAMLDDVADQLAAPAVRRRLVEAPGAGAAGYRTLLAAVLAIGAAALDATSRGDHGQVADAMRANKVALRVLGEFADTPRGAGALAGEPRLWRLVQGTTSAPRRTMGMAGALLRVAAVRPYAVRGRP